MSKATLDIEIKTYIDDCIAESEQKFDLRLEALYNIIEKAERLLEIRLAGLNEWREQNAQQTAKHATKQELESGIDILKADVNGRMKVIEALMISIILLVVGEFLARISFGG